MGLFSSHKPELMKRSPLFLAVPYEGTDTVVGLRPMVYGQNSGVAHDVARLARKASITPPSQDPRSSYKRYRGPHLEHLPHDIWKKPPKSWRHFLFGATECVYNLPEDTDHLQERIEENIVTYVSNYIWLAAGFLLGFVMFNWAAMFGVAAICCVIWLNYVYPPPSAQAQQLHQAEDQWAGLRTVAVVVTWIVVLYTQCTALLLKWAGMTLTAVVAHAILRCTVSEDVEALGSQHHAGVPLMAFVGDFKTREQPEPRKLAHQVGAVLHEQGGLLWNQAKFYSYYLVDAVRYPYVLWHHFTDPRHT